MSAVEIAIVLLAFGVGFVAIWYLIGRSANTDRARQLIDRAAAGSLTPQQILGVTQDASAAELLRARDQRIREIGADTPVILTAQETAMRHRAVELVEQAYRRAMSAGPTDAS